MDFTIKEKWLDIAQKLEPELRSEFIYYIIMYAVKGIEIEACSLVKLIAGSIIEEIDKTKELSAKRAKANHSRHTFAGRYSYKNCSATGDNLQQDNNKNTTKGSFVEENQQQNYNKNTTKLQQNTTKDGFVEEKAATACKFEGYDVDVLSLDGEKGEIPYTHNTNNSLNNNYINNLNSCTSNSGVCEEKTRVEKPKSKPAPKPRKTPEQKMQEAKAKQLEFHNDLMFFVGTYGQAFIDKFERYYSAINNKTYKLRFEEDNYWNLEAKLQKWHEEDLQKQQLNLQNNGNNRQPYQPVSAETEDARRQREHDEFIERLTRQADEEMRRIHSGGNAQYDGV